jgi:murein DD-endopeptidase MepM/ murein hydrolase activator NlpD
MPHKHRIQVQLYSKGTDKPESYSIPVMVVVGWLLGLAIIVLAFKFWLPGNMISEKFFRVFEIAKEQRSMQLTANKMEKQISEVNYKIESGNSLREKVSQLAYLENSDAPSEAKNKKMSSVDFERVKATLGTFKELRDSLQANEEYAKSLPLSYPLRRKRSITNKFGIIQDPFTKTELPHRGLDFAVSEGDTVIATGDGIIEGMIKQRSGFGITLEIHHSPNIKTVYSHLQSVLAQPGKHVKKGQAIALAGRSGSVLWPVLHYEVRLDNQPINPEDYFITP